jgi:cytochrome P450
MPAILPGWDMPENTYHRAPEGLVAAPPGCPVHTSFSPLNDDYLDDPYPIASALRDRHRLFFAEPIGHVVVSRMDDIEYVFTHPEIFASTNVQDPVFPLAPEAAAILSASDFDPVAVMSNRPEPDHGRIRVYTRQGFGNRRLRALEDYMRSRANDLLDTMIERGPPTDYVEAFAFPLPAEIMFRLIGFPPEDDAMVKAWCVNRRAFSWGKPTSEEQVGIAQGMLAYWRYCRRFVAQRREQRADDLTSELLDAHDADPDPSNGTGISYREVESVVYGISFAGHDPVTALLCNTLLCLLPRRDQWDSLVTDPSLVNNAVEESLRFESAQISWRRITTQDTTLGGVELPAGTRLYLNFAAAHRQPDVFDDPDTFDLHRANANRHIAFGKGIHFCLGQGLAKMEARIALELLAERLPSLRLVEGQALEYFPNITFRGPNALRITWDT